MYTCLPGTGPPSWPGAPFLLLGLYLPVLPPLAPHPPCPVFWNDEKKVNPGHPSVEHVCTQVCGTLYRHTDTSWYLSIFVPSTALGMNWRCWADTWCFLRFFSEPWTLLVHRRNVLSPLSYSHLMHCNPLPSWSFPDGKLQEGWGPLSSSWLWPGLAGGSQLGLGWAILYFFWPRRTAYGILVPQPGTEPGPTQ